MESQGRKLGHVGSAIDLSQQGARIQTEVPLSPGQTVDLVPSGGIGVGTPCRVVWVRAPDPSKTGEAGLEFLN